MRALDLKTTAVLVLAAGCATLAGAWAFEYLGYAPCELCLKGRWAYYAGMPLAVLALATAGRAPVWARWLIGLVALVFLANVGLSIYHSGVEMKWWPGPAECAGGASAPGGFSDFQKQLQTVRAVRCDEPALRVFGLTLANWNIFISAALALAAARAALRR